MNTIRLVEVDMVFVEGSMCSDNEGRLEAVRSGSGLLELHQSGWLRMAMAQRTACHTTQHSDQLRLFSPMN